MNNKVKSFTLSELVIAMIITIIVVGLAFTVLNLVKKQILSIQKNYSNTTELAFFKQQIWLDFTKHSSIEYIANEQKLLLKSEIDSIYYTFDKDFCIRNNDTLKVKLSVKEFLFQGVEIKEGNVDAISFSESNAKVANSNFFVFKKNDATIFMNQDGF